MKKSTILKDLPNDQKLIVKELERLQLYKIAKRSYFFRQSQIDNASPAMLTHFTKYGLKFKVLTYSTLSYNGYYHIRYDRLNSYNITLMTHEDLPLHIGTANQFMSDAFKRAKSFKK